MRPAQSAIWSPGWPVACGRVPRVIVVISTAVGLCLWVVLWSLGAKGFDGGMLFLLVVLLAATARGVAMLLPGNQEDEGQPDAAPFN